MAPIKQKQAHFMVAQYHMQL